MRMIDLLTKQAVVVELDPEFVAALPYRTDELASFGGFLCHSAIACELKKAWVLEMRKHTVPGQVWHRAPTRGWVSRNRWRAVKQCIKRVGRNPQYWTPEGEIERIWAEERSTVWTGRVQLAS